MDSMCKRQIILLRSLLFSGGRLSTVDIIKISFADWDTARIWGVFDKTLVQGRLALAQLNLPEHPCLQPHFRSSIQAFDISGSEIQRDFHLSSILHHLAPSIGQRHHLNRVLQSCSTRYYLDRLISQRVVVARTPIMQTNNFIDTARMWNLNESIKVRCKM